MSKSKNIDKNIKEDPRVSHKYKPYLVTWTDAQSCAEWEEIDDVVKWGEKPSIINEIGWLISENKTNIVMASEIGQDGSIGNKTKIPNTWVIDKMPISIKIIKSIRGRK